MHKDISELKTIANNVRIDIIKMISNCRSGHPGGSLSATDIITALYFNVLKHDPKQPDWNERDRFVLSKGHCCPTLYSVLAECGYIDKEELMTFREIDSRLQGHPSITELPFLEASTGSLGQGISAAVGMAIGFKIDNLPNKVYCMIGDGESEEGQVWEAAMFASHYMLDNLCIILDSNKLQIDGFVKDIMSIAPIEKKWKAFGFNVINIDGHNFRQILDAFEEFKKNQGKPTIIIADTIKGKGVSYMENKAEWHGVAPDENLTKQALKELGEPQ